MALKESTMMALGTQAPDFNLMDAATKSMVQLSDIRAKHATVVMFICNHCPYVIHVNSELVQMANDYMDKGVSFVAISSNDAEHYPEDGPEQMALVSKVLQFPYPYLYDETQEVAKAYDAACTPDFYVFDKELALRYRGRLDESRPQTGTPLTGKDLRGALDQLIAGESVSEIQYPSAGCSLKWKK